MVKPDCGSLISAMQFSRRTDYGFILIKTLAPTYASGAHVSLSLAAERERLPLPFLEKVAAALKRHGILTAKKGVLGGYRLLRDPAHITLGEVIRIFDEPPMMRCLHSPHPEQYCPLVGICPTRRKWREVEQQVNAVFEHVTVADV